MAKKAKYFQAKIAFEIPRSRCAKTGTYGIEYKDELVNRLMDLFDEAEFESENVCNPPLLIVTPDQIPTPEWIQEATRLINEVLDAK